MKFSSTHLRTVYNSRYPSADVGLIPDTCSGIESPHTKCIKAKLAIMLAKHDMVEVTCDGLASHSERNSKKLPKFLHVNETGISPFN